MPARLWYLRVNGRPAGPFQPQDLQRLVADGRLGPDDRLRRDGDVKWHRAESIAGLFCRPAGDRGESPRADRAAPEPTGSIVREFNDVSSVLRRNHFDQRGVQRARILGSTATGLPPPCCHGEPALRLASSAAEAIRPSPVCSPTVIGVAAVAALMIYFSVAALAVRAAQNDKVSCAPTHEPTVFEAATSAREVIVARTDPKTAEITRLELLRQTERASETSPAWFTFRGEVRWTNKLGTPVEADCGVIVRYDPRLSVYVPDLITLSGRVVMAQIEICGHTREAEFDQLARELFER